MNPNEARAKGTRWESQLVEYLNSRGLACHRLPLSSPKGDIEVFGIPCAVEAKNHRKLDLGDWCRQALASAHFKCVNAYAVLHKRIGFGKAEDGYATVSVAYLADLWLAQKELEAIKLSSPKMHKVDL